MGSVIAVSNQKGGVGKTTSVVNLAGLCALAGKRVLVIDSDPQGNATSVLAPGHTGDSIYARGKPVASTIAGVDCCPSGSDLIDQERALHRDGDGHFRLRQLMDPYRPVYDVVFVDCPPNLSFLPTNALLASDWLLVPLQCEYYALEGLSQLLAYIEHLRETAGAKIELAGVLLTMHQPESPLARQVVDEIHRHFPDNPFRHPIPRDLALAAAPSHSAAGYLYDPLSPGAVAYLAAAKELLHVIG